MEAIPFAPELLEWERLPALPSRRAESHKGQHGHVLVIGGANGMGGAAALAALGAYRVGAGLVTVSCHESATPALASWVPEAMRVDWLACYERWNRPGVVLVIGPGMGQGLGSGTLVEELASFDQPQVWDADALNLLAMRGRELLQGKGPRVLTPHPGEAARLLGVSVAAVQANREEGALRLASEYDAIAVLKGHGTLIASPDGRLAQCSLGNPGMATGGMGDVLAGIIGAFLGQGLDSWQAATMGVCLHSRAGDLAALRVGQHAMMARDCIAFLPQALKEKIEVL